EKRNADSNAVAEGEALFDLYLTAYYGAGTRVATHTHEAVYEPQAAPQPERGLTASSSLGQAAPIQPETASQFLSHSADGGANIGGQHEVPAHSEPVIPNRRPGPRAPEAAHNGDEHQRTASPETNEAPAGRVADESPAPLSFADRIKKLRPL